MKFNFRLEYLSYFLVVLLIVFEARYFILLRRVKKSLSKKERIQKLKNRIYLRAYILNGLRSRSFPIFVMLLPLFIFAHFFVGIVALVSVVPIFYSMIYWNQLWISKTTVYVFLANQLKIIGLYILVAALGGSIFSVLAGFFYKYVLAKLQLGEISHFIKVGMIFGSIYLTIIAAPLMRRMRFLRSPTPEDLERNMKLLFDWAKLKMPNIYYIEKNTYAGSIVELVGLPKENGVFRYTLFISERALEILKPTEIDSYLRREICRVKLGYLDRGMLFHCKRLVPAVFIGHLVSVLWYFHVPAISRLQIAFAASMMIYWWLMKSRARADEQILDVFAFAKLGASKVVLYSALKKMAWETGNVLNKTSFLDFASPFRSSLSVFSRAAIIFKKDMSLTKINRVPSVMKYRSCIQFCFLMVFILMGLIYFKFPKENQLLFAIVQKNSQKQDRLIKNGTRLDSDYFRIMGIEPLIQHSVIKKSVQ